MDDLINDNNSAMVEDYDVTEPENNGNYRVILYVATALIAVAGLYVAWLYISSDRDWGYEIEWKFWKSTVLWPALSFIGFFLQFIDWQHTSFKEGWVVKDSWGKEKFVENNDILSVLWGSCLFPLIAHFFLIPCMYGAFLYYIIIAPLALVNALIPYLAAILCAGMAVLFYSFARNFEWKSKSYIKLSVTTFFFLLIIWLLSLPTNASFKIGSNDSESNMNYLPVIGHANVTVNVANLRKGPGTDYDFYLQANGEKMQLKKGDRIDALLVQGDWIKIQAPDGGQAYIKSSLCSDIEYTNPEPEVIEEVNEEDGYVVDSIAVDSNAEAYDRNGVIIYRSLSDDIYCDGQYTYGEDVESKYFSTNLEGLNRKDFRLSFDFIPENQSYVLVLSTGYRVLGVYLHEDGHIYITTNNQENFYKTRSTYSINSSSHLDIVYVHAEGKMFVNGELIKAEINTESGDNILSSWNYSNGQAFKGWLKNIVVESF